MITVLSVKKNVYKKIGQKPSRGQIVKSQKISVFIMLSCWISPSNGNLFSIPFQSGRQRTVLSHVYIRGLSGKFVDTYD